MTRGANSKGELVKCRVPDETFMVDGSSTATFFSHYLHVMLGRFY